MDLFEIRKGCYFLPQSGRLSNDLLHKRIGNHSYYECATTPGLWRHQWHPITFVLLVDDFGSEYVAERHSRHLQMTLKENYDITMDREGKKISGMDIKWDYVLIHKNCKSHQLMKDYIDELISKVGYTKQIKAQLSPHLTPTLFLGPPSNSPPTPIRAPHLMQRAYSVCKKLSVRYYIMVALSTNN